MTNGCAEQAPALNHLRLLQVQVRRSKTKSRAAGHDESEWALRRTGARLRVLTLKVGTWQERGIFPPAREGKPLVTRFSVGSLLRRSLMRKTKCKVVTPDRAKRRNAAGESQRSRREVRPDFAVDLGGIGGLRRPSCASTWTSLKRSKAKSAGK